MSLNVLTKEKAWATYGFKMKFEGKKKPDISFISKEQKKEKWWKSCKCPLSSTKNLSLPHTCYLRVIEEIQFYYSGLFEVLFTIVQRRRSGQRQTDRQRERVGEIHSHILLRPIFARLHSNLWLLQILNKELNHLLWGPEEIATFI